MSKSLLVGLIAYCLLANPARAASLASLQLATDGSSAPPGDRLDLAVIFDRGEQVLSLEVRCFAQLENDRSRVVPVRSRNPHSRGPAGDLLLRSTLKNAGTLGMQRHSIVVPYADLELPTGRHLLGYEVKGIAAGKVQFVRATEMTVVVVSDRTRTEMTLVQEVERTIPVKRTVLATIERQGRLETRPVEVTADKFARETTKRRVAVQIPGGFERPKSYAVRGDEELDPEASPKGATVAPLQDRPWAPLSQFEPAKQRTIYFATNRDVAAPNDFTANRFGSNPSDRIAYGACVVDIPVEAHAVGQLETPSWWQRRDPEKHFLIEQLNVLAIEDFKSRIAAGDVLLYIHGYNTNFEYAVLRTAQLVHDLKFPGPGLAFSWPSTGGTTGYLQDESNNAASVPALTSLFKLIAGLPGAPKIHVIVHSMGNRLFLAATREYDLAEGAKSKRKLFGNVALAAPDVDAATFSALLPSVLRQAETATLYYCETDRALLASQTLHQNKPVGLGQFFAEGLDTINAEHANTSFLGHGYFASEHPLLQDLTLLLAGKRPPNRLPPLREAQKVFGYPLWAFRPSP